MNYIALADGMCVKVIDGTLEVTTMDERHKPIQEIIDEIEN